jgi:hypothetical protein
VLENARAAHACRDEAVAMLSGASFELTVEHISLITTGDIESVLQQALRGAAAGVLDAMTAQWQRSLETATERLMAVER